MNLNDFRQKIPQLNGLDDQAALDLLHKHYYPDVDKQRMADVLGVKTPPPPAPERSMARAAGDLGLQFAGGAVSGVRMMSDLFGADNAVSGGLRSAEDALRELQSAAAKADQQRIAEIMKEAENKGFGEQVIAGVKAFGQAPAAMIAQALGTSVPTLATALIPGVGQGAMAARLAAGAGVGAAQGAGNIKGVIYDEVMGKPLAGETQEQTKARAEAAQAYGGENTGQIVVGGVLGAAAGSTGMERALSGLRNGVTQAAPGMVARVGMGAAAEAVPEIAQGGQEKLASNLALRNEGFDVDPMAGVVAGATMEGLAGGLTGGATAIPRPAVIGEREPVPVPVEPPGPMTKAVNALGPRLTATPTADLLGRNTDPLAGQMTADRLAAEDAAVTRQNFADRNGAMLAGGGLEGSRADPLANMLADARTSEANSFTNVQQAASRRPPMPASDVARILDEAKNRGMDLTAAPHPDGGFVVVPRQWVTPDVAAQAETEIADTLARMQQADAAPVERAERRRSEPVDLNLNTDPVAGYIEDLRNTNTPAARAYVGEFDAGRVTRAEVEQRMQADRGKTADERLAEAAAEGLKLNPKGDPFKTLMAANLAAKTTPGTVIEVPGGYAIRPQESTVANTAAQEVPEADAAPVQADEPAAAVSFADAADEAGGTAVSGGDEQGAVQALSNVQDAPQAANDTAAETQPVEAPAPARGDGAAAAGVPDAGAGAGVRADGVSKKQVFNIGGRDPHTVTFEHKDDGRLIRTITYPDGQANTETLVTDRNGDESWVSQSAYEKGEFYPAQLSGAEASTAIRDDISGKAVEPAAPGAGDVRSDGVKKPPFAKKEDVEHLFGIDQKRKAALDRIAKGTAYFGTNEKAADFVAKSGIKDTHEVVQAKPGRFEIRAKAGSGMQTADAAPTEQVKDAPDWWKSKTPAERVWTLKASGVKGTAVTPWARISPADQKKLNDQWGPKDEAPAVAPESTVKPTKGPGEQLAELNAELERQGPVQNANTRAKRDQIRREIAERDFPEILKAVDGDIDTAEDLNRAFQYAGDEPKAKTVERILKKRGITPEYQKVWTGRLVPQEAAPAKPAASANTIFTEDAAAAARALLKKKLSGGTLNSGIDPEILQAGITLAGYHIEKGARTFAAYAKAMVGDLGDSVKPYLKSWYAAVALDPRATGFSGDMTTLGDVMTADVDKLAAQADTVEDQNRDDNATRPLDRPGQGALEGAPAADVQGTAEAGPAGRAPTGSRGGDQPGDAGADGAGVRAPRGMGGDPAAVPVSAGRARNQRGSAGKRGAAPDARDEREPSLFGDDGAGDSRGEAGRVEPPAFQPTDFTIEEDFALGEGGQKAKYRANVDAIRLLQKLEAEQRHATPDEQKVLAKYVGWGGVSQAFDAEHKDWGREFAELRELLSDEEYNTARRSTRYAHYTSRPIIQGMYDAMKRFGFTGGKMLEPGAGVGNFMGLMPADLRSGSRLTGVERERIAAGIARHLYPNQNMQLQDFTQFNAQDGYFDAVIGNPPFAKDPLTDSSGRKHLSGMAVHDYFFAKSVDMLRDGGVFAAVVSNGFMDKAGDRARKYIGERTKLLGAIRLPNNAFAKNANTEVTTDIVFLQKLPESEWGSKAAKADLKRWLDVTTIPDPKGGDPIKINQYFADNPQMMLGEYGRFGTMYGPDQPALVARPGQDTTALLRAAIERLPAGVYQHAAVTGTNKATRDVIEALRDKSVQEGGFYVDGGKLYQRMQDVAGESSARLLTPETQWTEKTTLGESRHERLVQLAGMRRTLRDLLAAELADDKAMEGLRKSLNEQYDAYAAKHGLINDPSTAQVFDDDPDFPLLAALEMNYARGMGPAAAKAAGIKPYKSKADKAPIFARRVIEKRQAVQKAETPEDALNVSIAERGRIDAGYIGQLLGRPADEVLEELTKGDKPALFVDPVTGEHVLRDAYLSGNVRKKLQQAEMAGMDRNVRALMEVQPEDVGAHEISARIGSPWVPTEVYQDFIKDLLGEGTKATVAYVPTNSAFFISVKAGSDTANNLTYGTSKMDAEAILNALLNNRTVKVTYTDSDGKTHLDKEGTDAAMEKAADIRAKFQDWIFADAERAEVLVRAYNDTNNNYVTRVYDGARMEFPGKVPDSIIKFRRHQRNAIARIVQDRTALLDHVVGAGKTFTVISGAMELKRTGLAKKPLIVVPNHLVKQWAADFYRLYPGANILTATKKDFARENRRRFLAKIATGDWDAVIMAHSSFGFIQPDPDFEVEFNEKQVAHIKAAIEKVDASDGDEKGKKRTVKQLEGLVERLENRIKSLRDKAVDNLLDFKQVGVDQLFVDEAHLFKNLMFSTKMQNVQGLGDSKGSQRAYDMYVKVNQLYAQNGRGQGVVFATGTPVSNTLAEMYHMMRYLMPAAMDEAGFQSFDAWANTFASVEQVWMQKPSGDGYKASDRMGTFSNVHELLKMFDQVSDTVTMEDIKTAYAEENGGKAFPLPKLKNDRRTPVSLVKSEAQNAYMDEIAERAKKLEAKKGPPQKGEDNFLTIMSDARKAAMDVRLVREDINDREPGARIDRSTDEVVSRYKQYDSVKGTQLVFSDLGTPLKSAKKELKEYEELKARIDAGNDADVQADAALGDEAAQAKIEDAEAAQEELDAKGRDWLGAIKAALRGFSVYDDFKAALIEKGIPENEIAFIHDFNTDDQKAALFRKVNAGQIRVLLGSTQKMGAGTNVQERLVALHHLDVPWKPSDIEQREGRIVRQGNRLADTIPGFEVEILAYVTQDTLDMRMWQTQEVKLKMVNQLRTRQISREIENPFEEAEMSAGEMQAAATGNMDLLREIQLRSDLKKLEQRKRSFDAQRNELASRRKRATDSLRRLPEQIADLEVLDKGARDYFTGLEDRPFKATINGDTYTSRAEAGAKLRELAAAHEAALEARRKAGDDAGKAAADAREDLSPAERTGIAMDAKDAYLKANPLPKMAVEFNGKTYGSKSALADAMTEFAGDSEPIEWSFDGQEFIRRKDIAAAIEAVVTEAIDTDTEASIGSIGGFKVTIEGQRDKFGSFVDMVVTHKGKTYDSTARINGDDKKQAADIVVRAAERMVASLPDKLQFAKYDLARAKKAMQELEKTSMPDTWPDMGKLEKARAEHKEVLKRLAGEGKKEGEEGGADTTLSIDDSTGPADTADYGPATQAHRDAAARLAESFADRIENGGSHTDLLDAVAPGDGKRGQAAAAVASIARRLFRRQVVFVKFKGTPLFNGVVSKSVPGVVFLNIDSQKPLLSVLGHELLHEMAKSHPTMYANLSRRLDDLIKNETEYAIRTYNAYKKAGISTKGLDAREELEADIVGDNFMDAEFWQAMGENQPGLFKRIVGFITRWLDGLTQKLTGYRAFGTDEFLADIEAARDAVASAMREFSGAEAGAVADPVDGDVKLSAARGQNRGTEAEAIAAGFTMKAYRGVSAAKPFNDSGTTWMTTSREVAEAYAEEVMGYEDPSVITVMVKPDGLKRHDASRLTDEQREQMQADDFGNPQAIGIYDRSDDHPLGGSRRNVTVIHAPKEAVWVVDDSAKQIKSATGNRGTFDPDNADIRFSMADDIKKAIPAFDVKTAPKNSWAHYRGMTLQALGRRQIVDLYAEELPQLAQYDYLVQKMDAEKNDSGAEADKLAQDWGKLKDEKQLAELMHDATLAQIDPAKPMEAGVLQAQYRELKARFDALTPEAQDLYRQARDMYDGHYRKVQKAIKERIERSEMSAGQKRQIMAKMDEELFKKLKGVYFPLARFGQYVIVVKDANGEVKNVTRAETVGEAEEARKELHKAFPKHMGYTVGKVLKQAEFNAGRDAVGKGFMADLMDALDAKGIDDELRDTVAQLYLSSLPDLSWAKHGIHRKGTPGFSQDARRAFAQNMFHGARYLAKLRYADQLQDELIAMQDHVKAYEGVDEYDSIQAQQVVDEMVKRHEIMMNPKTSGVSTWMTSMGFVFHLGLSPASAMVNLSQTALVAYPMMGAKWGWGKASAALLAASQDVVKAKNDLGTILKGAELDAYERAVKDGTIDVTMAHDLAGISQGEDQKVFWKIRPVMRAASFMFHHAERFNRQATFIAAWRMAKEAGPDKTADQLYEEAKKLTYDSHFDYSASNRPRVMQGNWQRVIFLFRQYSQAMVYTLSRNAYLSMKGLTPADRALARRNLSGILATHAAAAGVLGLPLVGPLLTAASFIGSDDDEPWDAEVAMQNVMADMVGPKAAEVMARGFSRLTPFDLSGRVALNKLILPDVQEGLEGKQWAESAMAAALGPVAGIGVNMARGFQKITEGHYMTGLEDMMPTALRGPLKAMRYASEGAVDKTGVVITDEVGPGSIAGQALGFSPSEVRRATERKAAIMDYDRSLADRRSALVRQWAEAQMAGDTDGVKDVMGEIQGFNQKNPNRKITMPNLIQSVRARRRRIEQAEDGVYLPKNREGAREAVRF